MLAPLIEYILLKNVYKLNSIILFSMFINNFYANDHECMHILIGQMHFNINVKSMKIVFFYLFHLL